MKNATTRLVRSEQTSNTETWSIQHIKQLQKSMIYTALEEMRDGRKSLQMKQEARDWILENNEAYPFSFVNCCECNGLNPYRLRWLLNKTLLGGLYD
ncbi:hypothetical protein AB4332_03620 [Vibrio breoganii]